MSPRAEAARSRGVQVEANALSPPRKAKRTVNITEQETLKKASLKKPERTPPDKQKLERQSTEIHRRLVIDWFKASVFARPLLTLAMAHRATYQQPRPQLVLF